MNRPDLRKLSGALLHRLRYQRLRGLLWSWVEVAVSPIGQVGLESLCQKDLTKPLTTVEARIPVTIGPAGEADIDQITALAEGLWAGSDEIGPYTRLGVRATILDRFDRGQKCFVARLGDEIVHYNWIGFGCEETIAGTGRYLHLDDDEAVCHDGMTVDRHRGKRVHLAVHNQMLIWLKENGYRRAYTVVGALDRSANITHHRLDWEFSGTMLYLITKRNRHPFVIRVRGTLDPFDERSRSDHACP